VRGEDIKVRRPIVVANWKMNKTIPEALQFVGDLRKRFKEADREGIDIVLAPPFTALKAVSDSIGGDNTLCLAAQNLFSEEKGAYTGEISAAMLLDSGCKYVIIGHSERRQYFGETDEGVNKKINRALYHNLIPLFCLGETLRQRDDGETFKIVRAQVEKGLDGLSEGAVSGVVIAYEPVWAIGTGKTAMPEQAEEVHGFIRAILRESYGREVSDSVRILYGGSVTPENIGSLRKEPDIDGALVGGASLQADSFVRIVTGSVNKS
jgi:triosephosphate isomerase